MGNLGAQNGLFLVFLCNSPSCCCRQNSRVKVNSTLELDLACQIRDLVSWSLSSTFVIKPFAIHSLLPLQSLLGLSFLPASLVGPSVFLTTFNYLKRDTLSLFPPRKQPEACPVSVALSQREGGRDPPQSVGCPGLPPFPSQGGAVKLVAYITQLAFSS